MKPPEGYHKCRQEGCRTWIHPREGSPCWKHYLERAKITGDIPDYIKKRSDKWPEWNPEWNKENILSRFQLIMKELNEN
jgi:hypothetical protein